MNVTTKDCREDVISLIMGSNLSARIWCFYRVILVDLIFTKFLDLLKHFSILYNISM